MLTGRVTPRLQLGVEWNPNAPEEKLNPVGNLFLQTETDRRPGIVAGFSSDRIGTPTGMSAFVSVQKQLGGDDGRLAPYAGLSYSQWGREILVPFGVSVALRPDLVLLPMCDGRYGHTTLTWFGRRGESLSLIAAFNRRVGLAVSRNF